MMYSASYSEGLNFVYMWAAASQDSDNLEVCREKTETLANELATTLDGARFADIAKGILKAMKDHPEAEEQIARLLARDIHQRGIPGIVNKSASFYVFNDLIAALRIPKYSSCINTIITLFSNIFCMPMDIRESPEIRLCVKQLDEISLRAWKKKDAPDYPSQPCLDLIDNEFSKMTFERLPAHQWLDLAKYDQHLRNRVISAINNQRISVKSLGISNSAQLQAFLLLFGKDLTFLNLKRCAFVSNEDLAFIAELVPNLQSLDVIECEGVTNTSVCYLVEKCPTLQHLYRHDFKETFLFLAQKYPNLKSLNGWLLGSQERPNCAEQDYLLQGLAPYKIDFIQSIKSS